MTYHTIGAKYEQTKNMDIAEIAKLIRQDIKQKHPAAAKSSVRIERFSNGRSIDVVVKGINAIHAEQVKQDVEDIVAAYNFDDSDAMSDYFHVRFYSSVKVAA